jgi:hypothetical protein
MFAILLLCLQGRRQRLLGAALALPLLGVGIPGDFRYPGRPDTQWPDQMAVFAALPQGASFFIPLQPQGYGGITVRKKTPSRAPSPLESLRTAGGSPRYEIEPPAIGGSVAWGDIEFLQFTGWAVDTPNRAPCGGVWVVIDERVFPAVCDQERPKVAALLGDWRYRAAGFLRHIPVGEVGLGRHRLSLVVFTHDRAGTYLLPGYDFDVKYVGEYLAVEAVSP